MTCLTRRSKRVISLGLNREVGLAMQSEMKEWTSDGSSIRSCRYCHNDVQEASTGCLGPLLCATTPFDWVPLAEEAELARDTFRLVGDLGGCGVFCGLAVFLMLGFRAAVGAMALDLADRCVSDVLDTAVCFDCAQPILLSLPTHSVFPTNVLFLPTLESFLYGNNAVEQKRAVQCAFSFRDCPRVYPKTTRRVVGGSTFRERW